MGLYKKNGLAALDIFNRRRCLTIIINSTEKRLSLFLFPMDERLNQAVCLLETFNDARNWGKLLRLAQKHFV